VSEPEGRGVAGERRRLGEPVRDRFTVVVITRDRRPELLRSLGLMTELPERPPVIVVDNGSTDGSADAVADRFPQVRLLRSPRNLGATARNVAVRCLDTPYVAFCDDDTWWEPGALTRAADVLDTHDGLASVTGRIVVEPGGAEDPIVPELSGSPVPGPGWLPGPALLGILAGATMLRVAAFREVGGFSSRLWLGGEEELLAIDLAAHGWWMCYRQDVLIHHAASACRDSRQRRRLGIRNTLWTTWLRRPVPSALRRTGAVVGSLPRDATSVRALADAVAGLPWVVRERRVVPRDVERGLRLLEGPQRRSTARRYVG
jgi:GT2 family glycosyltransferase